MRLNKNVDTRQWHLVVDRGVHGRSDDFTCNSECSKRAHLFPEWAALSAAAVQPWRCARIEQHHIGRNAAGQHGKHQADHHLCDRVARLAQMRIAQWHHHANESVHGHHDQNGAVCVDRVAGADHDEQA